MFNMVYFVVYNSVGVMESMQEAMCGGGGLVYRELLRSPHNRPV